jgi:hypothetical protein
MAAGQEIMTFCTTCKIDLRHVIVAHRNGNTGAVAKVRCNTCSTIHAYRNKPTEKSIAAAAARKAAGPRKKVEVVPVEVEWQEQMSKASKTASIAYSPQKEFKVGDVMEHPSFGAGFVRLIKEGNKLEAIFQKDIKLLVHRMKA